MYKQKLMLIKLNLLMKRDQLTKPIRLTKASELLKVCLVLALLTAPLTTLAVKPSHSHAQKPNILMIAVDDLRPVLGAYGDLDAITPNIDKLAQNGVRFNRAYTNIPVCGASRASLMTSVRPTEKRFINFLSRAETDAPGAVSLPQIFKQAGYLTVSNGKVFHHSDDLDEESWSKPAWRPSIRHEKFLHPDSKKFTHEHKGFGLLGPWYESADVEDAAYFDGQVARRTIRDLNELAKQNKPFFLAAGFFRPHLPFYAPTPYFDMHKHTQFKAHSVRSDPLNAPKSLKGSREIKLYPFKDYVYNSDDFHIASLKAYYACVTYVDKLVGDILKELEKLSLRENTMIVLWSDHGFFLGEHNYWGKHNLLQDAIRIPLIISGDHLPQNKSSNALVELVDLFPTLAEMVDIPLSESVRAQISGSSFVPTIKALAKNHDKKHKPYVFVRFKTGEAVVSENYSYVEYKVGDKRDAETMLFNLKTDPEETVNIVGDSKYKHVVDMMKLFLNAERNKLL